MLTIAPAPWASIVGSTCLQVRKTLLRLTSTCESQTSSDSSTGPPGAEPPTLLTSTSMRAEALEAGRDHRRDRLALEVTSQLHACAIDAARFAGQLERLVEPLPGRGRRRSTRAPSSASRTAIARPLPQPAPTQPAPVTMATLSFEASVMHGSCRRSKR